MGSRRVDRRTFLRGAAAVSAAGGAFPAVLRAQPRTIKVGMVEPVSGPMADVGQDSRLGAQLAVEAVNAGGGIKSMGGAKLELLTADSQTRVEVARAEAERLINAGAQLLMGAFHSAHVATIAPLAQQDNPNASTAMLRVLGQKTRVVWPQDVAERRFVFPRPRA